LLCRVAEDELLLCSLCVLRSPSAPGFPSWDQTTALSMSRFPNTITVIGGGWHDRGIDVREQVISAAINIVCGLVVAFIYDWFRARPGSAPASPNLAGPAPTAGYHERAAPPSAAPMSGAPLPAARGGGGFKRAFVLLVVLAAAGFAAAVTLHRLGLGATRPGLEMLIKHAAVIAGSMLVFVFLLGRLRR